MASSADLLCSDLVNAQGKCLFPRTLLYERLSFEHELAPILQAATKCSAANLFNRLGCSPKKLTPGDRREKSVRCRAE